MNATPAQLETKPAMVSEAIIDAVAAEKGVDPVELTPPVFQYVDPDALDAMFKSADDSLEVTFTAWGRPVTVESERGGYDVTVGAHDN